MEKKIILAFISNPVKILSESLEKEMSFDISTDT